MMAQEILLHVGIAMGAVCCDVRECSWMCRGELCLCCFVSASQWRFVVVKVGLLARA